MNTAQKIKNEQEAKALGRQLDTAFAGINPIFSDEKYKKNAKIATKRMLHADELQLKREREMQEMLGREFDKLRETSDRLTMKEARFDGVTYSLCTAVVVMALALISSVGFIVSHLL